VIFVTYMNLCPFEIILLQDHKEGEQLEDQRKVGGSNCSFGGGTDQRVQSFMFKMIMIMNLCRENPNLVEIGHFT